MDKHTEEIKCQLITIYTDIGILFYLAKDDQEIARVEFCDGKDIDDLREVDDAN